MSWHNYEEKRLDRANCNGVLIELVKVWSKKEPEEDAYFMSYIADQYDDSYADPDEYEYETEEEGRRNFESFVNEYKNKPNWNAQAAYDEAHGTINGEDQRIVEMRELWGEG